MTEHVRETAQDIESIDAAIATAKSLLERLREAEVPQSNNSDVQASPISDLLEQAEEILSLVERIEKLVFARHALRRLKRPANGRLQ